MSSRNKIWKDKEIDIIKKYYEEFGSKKCSDITGRSRRACSDKAKKLNIKYDRSYKWKQEKLEKIIVESFNISECLKKMELSIRAGNYETFNKYVKKYNIDISHFVQNNINGLKKQSLKNKKHTSVILVENSTFNRGHLKERLYEEGLKERVCEICGQDENWKSVKISLILDHINGINDDNRIENLRIVCPNCNAGLKTHCKGQRKSLKQHYYCSCGEEISKGAEKCKKCSSISQQKVDRPSYEQLKKEIEESNYLQVGKKYGVSDNSIRKWVNKYENEN